MQKKLINPNDLYKTLVVGMPPDPNLYVTKNFKWQELLTKQKEVPCLFILQNLFSIATLLQYYRDFVFNSSPITITSGWRSVNYNAKIGGAARSYHTKGMALDFTVKGYSPLVEVQKNLDDLHKGGLEYAPSWTHIDLGANRRFDTANNAYTCIAEYLEVRA